MVLEGSKTLNLITHTIPPLHLLKILSKGKKVIGRSIVMYIHIYIRFIDKCPFKRLYLTLISEF